MKRFIALLIVAAALMMLVPSLAAQSATATAEAGNTDVYGRPLPDDAAPYNMQTFQELCDSTAKETSLSAVETVYDRICEADLFGDALVNLDQNLHLIPAAADSWDVSADGLTWHFHIHPGLVWSDGTPVTANDWVASFQYMVNPKHAYDFVWLWNGTIAGWDQAEAGEIPPDQIGVTADPSDPLILDVKTQGPLGYLPSTMIYWPPLQAAALAKAGSANYQLDPKTSVSSGPFMLKSFTAGSKVDLVANPTYTGSRKPVLSEIIGVYGDALNGSFLAFQHHDVDHVNYANLSSADLQTIVADPVMSKHYLPNMGDFRTDYLLMDTYSPPFNNHDVRLAFAKALDRESIVKNVINAGGVQLAIPAYSFLAPGFPGSDTTGSLNSIQGYDCPAAQKLLAGAGYPDGKGFPSLTLDLRGESADIAARFNAAAASISDCLHVTIAVNNMEYSAYMTALLARPTQIQFGAISYGMDYLDDNNMLGSLWNSSGRHSWRNADFDALAPKAAAETDPDKRLAMYQQMQQILVSDVGGIFLDYRVQGDLYQPYVAGGDCFKPDAQGVSAFHWGNNW
ncbi:MAG TPA: peptide ABC transporter substrate-binding protein, partial [Phototrophicaceae bacterium]|nr:peptide ABC transporter substrate-binding protein [Phototrophicaceae bacterium]